MDLKLLKDLNEAVSSCFKDVDEIGRVTKFYSEKLKSAQGKLTSKQGELWKTVDTLRKRFDQIA